TEAWNNKVANRRVWSLEEAMQETGEGPESERDLLTPQELITAWRSAKDEVVERFCHHWNSAGAAQQTCRLLLLDNFDEIATQELGAWLRSFLGGLDRTAVVLTTGEGAFVSSTSDDLSPEVRPVGNFEESEVKTYLDDKVKAGVSDDEARQVHTITD